MRPRAPRLPPRQQVALPYRFVARSYQRPALEYLSAPASGSSGKRAVLVHHRKAGKDLLAFNYTIWAAAQRPGLYLHLAPDSVQARRIIWDGIHAGSPVLDGAPFLSHVPAEMLIEKNETEMSLRFHAAGGQHSIWQLVGTDRFERLRGPAPVGLVFSEFSYMSPGAWEALAPALGATGGWAIFIFTPNGPNHAKDLFEYARKDPAWFVDVRTVEETRRDAPGEDGAPVVAQEYIDAERRRGVPEEWLLQEYWCDFSGIRTGSYYGELLARADAEKRVTEVPYDPMLPVEVWYDLGRGQSIACWMVQTTTAGLVRVIDCLEGKPDEDISHVARALMVRPYNYACHIMPWDAQPYADRSRVEWAERLGLRPVTVAGKAPVDDGISAVKALLPRCVFDAARCAPGLKALRAYHREWDEKASCFKDNPKHDWASHFADAFRTGAMATRGAQSLLAQEIRVETQFDLGGVTMGMVGS